MRESSVATWSKLIGPSAIGLALKIAAADDAVVIAGKGHEDYQLVGGRRLDFDDRVVVREITGALNRDGDEGKRAPSA